MQRHVIPILGMVLLTLGSASLVVAQTSDSAAVMLETAKSMEVIDGNLAAAIEQYEAIVSRYPDRRPIAAEALLRMGGGYEKLGQARAREVYERLVRDYADQAEPVATARARLAALAVEPTPPSPASPHGVAVGRSQGRLPRGQRLTGRQPGDLRRLGGRR